MKCRWLSFVGATLVAASAAAPSPGAGGPSAALPVDESATRDLGGKAERRLNELTRETEAAELELGALARDVDAAHARTITRGRAYVRLAKAGLLPIGGGFDALVEHAVRLERLRQAIGHDLALVRELSARRLVLGRRLSDLEASRSSLQSEVQAMSVAEAALLSEQDRAQAFARAFSGAAASNQATVYGAGVGPSDPALVNAGFASLKGHLAFPITGRTEIRNVHRPGADGPGMEMFAPSGSVVRAVHAGRVAFADTYAAYGRTVILDHGGGYYTVSANLGSIEVKVGDDLPSGSRIGTVGEDPGGSAARLYFEIRAGSATVAAAHWFGI